MGIIVAVVSDTHINSTIGLSLPTLELDDGGEYKASTTQRDLWLCWNAYWDEVEQLKTRLGYRLLAVFNGDLGELDAKSRSHQIISRNKSTALRHVRAVIERPIQMADWALFIRGTQSHVGKSSWFEEEVAQDCDIAIRNGEAASWWTFRRDIGGVVIDFQHFVRLGGKPWNVSAPLGELAVRLELDAYRRGRRLPALAIRSHRHTYADTGSNHVVRAIVTPAFQAIPDYIPSNGVVEMPDIGGLIITIDEGSWTVTPKRFPWKAPKLLALP